MTAKEYLRQAYLLDKRIESCSLECADLRQMAESISGPGFEEHFNASKNTDAPYIRTLEDLWDMEEKILYEQALLVRLKAQISEVISKVEKPEYQMLMRYRYIHNFSWSKISEMLSADITTVQRWHTKALTKIKLPENAINLKVAMVCHKMP